MTTELPRHSAMPEWLSPRTDITGGAWVVENGPASRGEAWTSLRDRLMRVPVGSDEMSRTVRAHEMMHARVSPLDKQMACDALPQYAPRIVECAEEFRINTLIKRAGFNVDTLVDGSESKTGKRLAENGNLAEAACYLGALAGTKGASDFLRGVRSVDAEVAKGLREMEKALLKMVRHVPISMGSTAPDSECNGAPMGFTRWTSRFAEVINAAVDALTPDTDENGEAVPESDEDSAERLKNSMKSVAGTAGAFAPLRLDTTVALVNRVRGSLGRKRTPTNIGRNPRRINRTLTDPERRIFDKTARGQGGIVVIDQSGSMSLSMEEVWEIVNAAPGCVIIGYSHQPGSVDRPNTWVIADRGRIAETFPSGRSGNGVDGPVLRYALSKRRYNEPVIWVCDGTVTDGKNDQFFQNLAEECARLVIRHDIHMVENVKGVSEAFTKVKHGERLKASVVGAIVHTNAWRERQRDTTAA